MKKSLSNRIDNIVFAILGDYEKLPFHMDIVGSNDVLIYGIVNAGINKLDKKKLLAYYKKIRNKINNKVEMVLFHLCILEFSVSRVIDEKEGIRSLVFSYYNSILKTNITDIERSYFLDKENELISGEEKKIINKIKQCSTVNNFNDIKSIFEDIINNHVIESSINKFLNVSEPSESDVAAGEFDDLEMNRTILSAEFTARTNEKKFSSIYKEEEKEKLAKEDLYYTEEQDDIRKKFGNKLYSERVIEKMEKKHCNNIHENCKIYFTSGSLDGMEGKNHLSEIKKQIDNNKVLFKNNQKMMQQQINFISESIKELMRKKEIIRNTRTGQLNTATAYRGVYLKEDNIFDYKKMNRKDKIVCDILIDGSGSLDYKQSSVALIAYIISRSLNKAGVRTRVSSFCSFVEYTIFREYKDYRSNDNEILMNHYSTGMNRDSLALLVTNEILISKEEKNKLLIYITDANLNDIKLSKHYGEFGRKDYKGKVATEDMKKTIKKIKERTNIISVFVGEDDNLKLAREMYGETMIKISGYSDIKGPIIQKLKKIM